jgi:hypothetical protein
VASCDLLPDAGRRANVHGVGWAVVPWRNSTLPAEDGSGSLATQEKHRLFFADAIPKRINDPHFA